MKFTQKFVNLIFLLLLILPNISYSQQTAISEFEYLSPMPGSEMNNPRTNIIIRYGIAYNSTDILSKELIEVVGDKSGNHTGEIILAEKNKTLLFNPDIPFLEGEIVRVKFLRPALTENNDPLPMLSFYFQITEHDLTSFVKNNHDNYLINELVGINKSENKYSIKPYSKNQNYSVMDDSLPENFPDVKIDTLNNPTPGYIFLAPFQGWANLNDNYIIIIDNYGVPVFYRQLPSSLFDFKKLRSGLLAYNDAVLHQYYILDSSYTIIDSLYTKNGYVTDFHELTMDENYHSFMLSYDWQLVAMDTVVPGGNPNATVIGLIVQEQDKNKNVVFQWRSWDYFKITDATHDVNLTDSIIDYVHGNAIEVDNDGNILISSRNMDEVTKINRQTGDIIWRLGGEYCENNQFSFINDPIGFSHQHDVRVLENGNITIFDNGNLHNPPFSRVVEYQLDELNKLAFPVWQYSNEPVSYSFAMGNARRLPNHNTFIGWGSGTSPAISEVKPNGDIALFLRIPDTLFNYRGFKYPWKTNLFTCSPENLVFGYVPNGDSLTMQLTITNNSNQQIEINDIYNREASYNVLETLPITIAPSAAKTISVKFKSQSNGDCFDDIHLRWETEGQRIAQIVPLIGSGDPNFTSVDDEIGIRDYYLSQNYPNPFNPSTTIEYQIPEAGMVSIKVYDILGNEITILVNEEKSAGSYKTEFLSVGLSSGIYFYRLQAGSFVESKKMILLK